MKNLLPLIGLMLIGQLANASLNDDMNSLGGNKELIRRAKAIDPKNRVSVVQNRTVDRDLRLELGFQFGHVTGGDPYLRTSNLGGTLDFHFNPRWSVGARYYASQNGLSSEGRRVFADANAARPFGGTRQDVDDFAKETYIGVINWYPMYGKINMFDYGISQFDIYLLGGAGQVKLNKSGPVPTYTGGGGFGFWLGQHVSSRFEARYQRYQDTISTGKRDINQVIFSATLGLML